MGAWERVEKTRRCFIPANSQSFWASSQGNRPQLTQASFSWQGLVILDKSWVPLCLSPTDKGGILAPASPGVELEHLSATYSQSICHLWGNIQAAAAECIKWGMRLCWRANRWLSTISVVLPNISALQCHIRGRKTYSLHQPVHFPSKCVAIFYFRMVFWVLSPVSSKKRTLFLLVTTAQCYSNSSLPCNPLPLWIQVTFQSWVSGRNSRPQDTCFSSD